MEQLKAYHLLIIGDRQTGKTCLQLVLETGEYPKEYVPVVTESCTNIIPVDGTLIQFGVYDSCGYEDYDRLRSLAYLQKDVIMICFSVDNPVLTLWKMPQKNGHLRQGTTAPLLPFSW